MKTLKICLGAIAAFIVLPQAKHETLPSWNQHKCLADNIWHESRSQGLQGMYLVGLVTLNRWQDGRFGATICSVVYKPYAFSWTVPKVQKKYKLKNDLRKFSELDFKSYQEALRLSRQLLGSLPRSEELWYHADYIKEPKWTKKLEKSFQFNSHVFYKEKQ